MLAARATAAGTRPFQIIYPTALAQYYFVWRAALQKWSAHQVSTHLSADVEAAKIFPVKGLKTKRFLRRWLQGP